MPDVRAVLCAAACLVLLSGCGDTTRKQVRSAMEGFQLNDEDSKLAFGRNVWGRPVADDEMMDALKYQIDRLSGPAWEDAWEELSVMGIPAVRALIPMVEEKDSTYATHQARPGIISSRTSSHFTLGELCHSLLQEMITKYSGYSGTFPVRSVAAWSDWWKDNSRNLRMTARVVTKGGRR